MAVNIYINNVLANNSIPIDGWSISMSGGWCFECRISFKGTDFLNACDPNVNILDPRIKIVIDGKEFRFLLEERSEAVTAPGVDFEIWGRSKHALLEKGCKSISDTIDTEYSSGVGHVWQNHKTTAVEIINYVISEYAAANININWNIPNYEVFIGTFEVQNQYPIDVIKRIAAVVGAEIVPEINGSLTIQEYDVDDAGQIPVTTYTDIDDILSFNSSNETPAGYNTVLIHGFNDVETDDITGNPVQSSTVNSYLRVVKHPEQTLIIKRNNLGQFLYKIRLHFFYPTDDYSTPILENIRVYKNEETLTVAEPEFQVVTRSEKIDLSWGQGNTAHPNTEGKTLVDYIDDYNIPFSTLENYEYQAPVQDYELTVNNPGKYRIAFYYDDWSAETEMSFEIPDIVEESIITRSFLQAVQSPNQPYEIQKNDIGKFEFKIRVFFFNTNDIFPNDLTEIQVFKSEDTIVVTPETPVIIPYEENIELSWGQGSSTYPNTNGTKLVESAEHSDIPLYVLQDHEYSSYVQDYTLQISNPGTYTLVFYYEDRSSESKISFTIPDITKDSQVTQSYLNAVQHPDQPDTLQKNNSGRYELIVRVFFYNINDLEFLPVPISVYQSDDNIINSYDSIDVIENIENISLSWGQGNTQYPNTEGTTLVENPAFFNTPLSTEQNYSYFAKAKDYVFEFPDYGDYSIKFYYADRSSETNYSVSIPYPESFLSIAAAPDQVFDTGENEIHKIRIVWFLFGATSPGIVMFPNIIVENITQSQEQYTEDISLRYGRGTQTYADNQGNIDVYVLADKDTPFSTKQSHTYNINVDTYELKQTESGEYQYNFRMSDDTNGDYSYSVIERPSVIIAGRIDEEELDINTDFTVRIHAWHPNNSAFVVVPASGDNSVITPPQVPNTLDYTETIDLEYGRGQYTYPDSTGNFDYYDIDEKDNATSSVSVTYETKYWDYLVQAPTYGDKKILIYYPDESYGIEFEYNIGGINSFIQTIRVTKKYADDPIEGITVYVEENPITDTQGLTPLSSPTNANGVTTTDEPLEVGKTYYVYFEKEGEIQNSKDDLLQNDSFVAQEIPT